MRIKDSVEEEACDLGGEALTRFMDNRYDQLSGLVNSSEVSDNLAAVRAIDELIDVRLGETATKIAKCAECLKKIFEEKQDSEVLIAASVALGHFARVGGALTADVVEYQVKRALDWLQPPDERAETRRFAAVLILKEMAEHASTVFNVHVSDFIERIWYAIRDNNLAVRERAVDALRACLCVIEKRETRWRVQWYYRLFERTQDGLGKNATVESIHGSLLAVGELLRNTREFMMSRYKEVADIVFKYREHRDRLVRRSITALLPRIANFLKDRFINSYLEMCMNHLLTVMRNPAERASGFVALGEMAGAVGEHLKKEWLSDIFRLIKDAITPRRGRPSMEALACIGYLAEALNEAIEDPVRNMLDIMFAGGLSSILVESLTRISSSIPSLLPTVQEKLLESISLVLAKKPYRYVKATATTLPRSVSSPSTPVPPEYVGQALIQLALRTLTTFNIQNHELLEFAREAIVPYLEDDDSLTRREAAICCCRLVEHSSHVASVGASSSRLVSHRGGRAVGMGFRRRRLLIEEILEKLLVAAVADSDSGVRRAVFVALEKSESFNNYLAQADSLRAIFIALTDESYDVRELAIRKAGKLADRNPAYVLPALRRHLQQLLIDLELSADSRNREESAKLLGCLISSCEVLLLPYIAPVLKALVVKLNEGVSGSGNTGVVAGVLATIGELSRVGGVAMRPYLPELMPLIVDALQDGASESKREIAVATLGHVVESTGYVVSPYNDYPQLLGLLLRLLNGELAWSTRSVVLRVLGIMGALDPHQYKRNQLTLQGPHGESGRTTAVESGTLTTRSMEDLPVDIWPSGGLFTTSEEYYPTVAINALMRILRDPSLSSYHLKVVGSLMYVFKKMGLGCVPYLHKVMPDLFQTVRTCEDGLRDFIFWCLAALVSIVRQHIRKYLPELLTLVAEFWVNLMQPVPGRSSAGSPVLNLVEHLCLALNDEFRIYLPEILPRCVQVLSDAERHGDYTYVPPVLHTFEVFGGSVDEHMHLLLPALVRLFRPDVAVAPIETRRAAIKSLTRLLPRMQVSGHVSALMHPFTRVLDGTVDELRKDALDAICALAIPLGADFIIFLPSTRKLLRKHRIQHKQFDEIEARLKKREPVVWDVQSVQYAAPVPEIGDVLRLPMNSFLGTDTDGDRHDMDALDSGMSLKVNENHLKIAWESSHRSTKEDWTEWMRHLSVELLKESPSPALRTCAGLAQLQPYVARELFAAGFVSCWSQLNDTYKDELVHSLQNAFSSPNIPPEILATLLNLAEFMEHDEKPIPIDIRTLGALAEKCHAYAKALHYKEMEFEQAMSTDQQPEAGVEGLIHINNQLQQHEAAVGILTYAEQNLGLKTKETPIWYEKLQRWEAALLAYEHKFENSNADGKQEAILGQMRCMAALVRWEDLNVLCRKSWAPADPARRVEMASMAASAAWNMEQWDEMAEYVRCLDDGSDPNVRVSTYACTGSGSGSSDGAFFNAVLCVKHNDYDKARKYVENARNCLATELAALVLESYDRAYSNMVRVQQLAELEEVIDFLRDVKSDARCALIHKMWSDRILGTKKKVEVWQAFLSVRTLAPRLRDDLDTWLKFASLCRKNGRLRHARACLLKLLNYDPEDPSEGLRYTSSPPQLIFSYLKYQWTVVDDESKRYEVLQRLQDLAAEVSKPHMAEAMLFASHPSATSAVVPLMARIHLKLGQWQWNLNPSLDEDSMIQEILMAFREATNLARYWSKAWHKWALFNTDVMNYYLSVGLPSKAAKHVVAAVSGYFCSIEYASTNKGGDDSLQDILRLLTLWFNHGASPDVHAALKDGLNRIDIDTWLVVLPQIIARIHSNIPAVRDLIETLLVKIGEEHPQALMYPLLVACKSISVSRKTAAQQVVDKVRLHRGRLVDEAQMVSMELIRVAILWHEMWHEALEEASRLFFGERNSDGMLSVLAPLHETLEKKGPVTSNEQSFVQQYGRELQEANEWCMKYRRTGKEAELTQAWDLYYHVFKRINKQLPSLTTLELQSVSPELVSAGPLELAVPGTYRVGIPEVTIAGFAPQLIVITSKQRPRRCTIHGSDGEDYAFLLKGHEDLRLDERVMQLFGLVNTLLANSRLTAEKDLSIVRYSVIPLAPNSGLIGWVPNCDTLHTLIREYRDARKMPVNMEHRLMLAFAPDYEHLTLMAKVEVFEHALEKTPGNDLAKVLWLKSRSSEVWLDRRTNYTRSLGVMSMVGYLLGLGDRHPSNLMLDRYSGKILHIDFGDCFEASMNREKFPEKVPFRLTRMLVKAMEVSGIEGTFKSTCVSVMNVLRTNKESVQAMMEAFVHDPLINWRLFNLNEISHIAAHPKGGNVDETSSTANAPSPPGRVARERELLQAVGQFGDANEVLIERALAVMSRMSNKLTGRDFSPSTTPASGIVSLSGSHALDRSMLGEGHDVEPGLSVAVQVEKLIAQARSPENLCQSYVGWCPFW